MKNFIRESEANIFVVFEEKHIEEENITDYLDAEDSLFKTF